MRGLGDVVSRFGHLCAGTRGPAPDPSHFGIRIWAGSNVSPARGLDTKSVRVSIRSSADARSFLLEILGPMCLTGEKSRLGGRMI